MHDISDDKGMVVLAKAASAASYPDYLLEADPSALPGDPAAPARAFADPASRRFYCGNKAAAYASRLYFEALPAAEKSAAVDAALDKFAAFWRIEADVAALRAGLAKSATTTPATPSYLLVIDGEGRLPYTGPEDLPKAAAWFDKYAAALPYPQRRDLARNILKEAGDRKPANLEKLEKAAGLGVPDVDNLATELWRKAGSRKPGGDYRFPEYADLALAIEKEPAEVLWPAEEKLAVLAEVIDEFDVKYNRKQVTGYRPPEDYVFAATLSKAAEELEAAVELSNGAEFDKAAMAKAASGRVEDLRDLFGEAFVAEATIGGEPAPAGFAKAAAALSAPDADVLGQYMASLGVKPVREAEAFRTLTDADWASLA